ncbi:MAG: ABC transporter permease [Oscillospiraceae bacterium]
MLAFYRSGNTLQSQKAAQAWAGEHELDFVQISCFLPVDEPLNLDGISAFRGSLDTELARASGEAAEGGSLYCDAWSTPVTVEVSNGRESLETCVTAVGGDFFRFHPLKLLSGSYLSANDLMHDRVLLDRELAWRLFGGTDLTGMTVWISGQPFWVAGVVERDSDRGSRLAFTGETGLYVFHDALPEAEEKGITCYEIVMPEPVMGFAVKFTQEHLSIGDGMIIQNTGRYSIASVLSTLRCFGTSSMQRAAVACPAWENAARYYQDWCALFLFLAAVFGAVPTASLCVYGVRALHRAGKAARGKIPALTEKAAARLHGLRQRRKI